MIRSSIWWNCAKLVEKLLQKQQERLLYFDIFRHHMSSYFIKPYIDGFYTSRAFQGYQEHQNWSSNKEVMQVPKLEENQQTLRHFQQERILYFDFFQTSYELILHKAIYGWILHFKIFPMVPRTPKSKFV